MSERNFLGRPRLAANLFTHRRNVAVVMSRTSSKWTARDTQQVNRHTHTFLLAFASLPRRYRGPAKSMAVYVNGGASFTRNSGRGGCGGALIGLPSYRLQTTQPWTTARMRPLSLIIQNFERTSVRVSLTPLWHTLWWASRITRMLLVQKYGMLC